jgi:transposase-like protein
MALEIPDDFPRTIVEFEERFSTENACVEFLRKLRWPNGFVCPSCSEPRGWDLTRGLVECASCHHQVSVRAGTVFHGSSKPLRLWFRAMFHMTTQKLGLSAKNFMRMMGFKSYQTAWTWLHKLRRAMVRRERPKLEGVVEVDEAFVGGAEEGPGKRGRGGDKAVVAAAVEFQAPAEKSRVNKPRLGRVRLDILEDATQVSITTFVNSNVSADATVRTDGLASYDELSEIGFSHEKLVLGDPTEASKRLPGVHRIFSLVKRWLLGTHQGAVSEKHLFWYLQEFTFRFNRRLSSHPGKLFHRLAEQAVVTRPTTFRSLVDAPPAEAGLA